MEIGVFAWLQIGIAMIVFFAWLDQLGNAHEYICMTDKHTNILLQSLLKIL